MKDVILTGIRANDDLTLGNYIGAFVPMVELQKSYGQDHQINMFVPDLHSFTTPIDHSTLQDNIFKNLKYYLAAGLDLDNPNTFIYRQSYIPAHSELTWILDCFAGFGEISRMTQFKDKSAQHADAITVGLFNYPVLMAADILLYNAKWVPVGEDQFQHLELARDLAIRMNNKFGELFTVPEATQKQVEFMGNKEGIRIRDLVDPTKKMSKSADSHKSKIMLSDTPQAAYDKIMSATTDNLAEINFDWLNQPGIANLLQILATLTGQELDQVIAEWRGKTRYGEFKKVVAMAVVDWLTEFQSKLAAIDAAQITAKLKTSESAMNRTANETLLRVQKAIGLR